MLGVVLAAGRGKRLRPLTETRPKVLLPILGKPIIWYHLYLMKRLGVERVVVVVSYLKGQVISAVRALSNGLGVDVDFVDQGEELGTAHAVRSVVQKYDDDMVIVYGDLYVDVDEVYKAIAKAIDNNNNYIIGVSVDDVSRYGKLVTDGDSVLEIVEKPLEGGRGVVNAGIYVLRRGLAKFVEEIGLSPRGEYELTDVVSIARRNGYAFKLLKIDSSYWQDIGYPWDLLKVVKMVMSRHRGRVIMGEVEGNVTIKGDVIVEENAVIKGSTYIEGPAYIGREAVVGPNSYIRPYTVIEEKAHIGFSVEVKESIVFENAHAAHLTYIGDSIIGEHVNLGAGTLIANLRLDNKTVRMSIENSLIDTGRRKMGAVIGGYVKTGVNVSIMPGVKVGSHSIIYPGVVVYKDVPPNTVVDRDWR